MTFWWLLDGLWLIAYGIVQDKAETKLKSLEVKAQEQQKARLAADEEWRRQQRDREMARLHVRAPPPPSP